MEANKDTILRKLYNKNVVYCTLNKTKNYMILEECCDHFFEAHLRKEEVKQMIDELTELYKQMV